MLSRYEAARRLHLGIHIQPFSPLGPFHTYERTAQDEVVHSRTECFCDAKDPYQASRFLKEGRLKALCERLRGGRAHVLLKEKINYKLAGAGGYAAHQDGYWQIERGELGEVGRG